MALVGEPLNEEVIRQLQQRENYFSLNDNPISGLRSNQDLFLLNSSNCWIRLISGADTLLENGRFSSFRAQDFVLWGGEASYRKFPRPNWKRDGGINFENIPRNDTERENRRTYNNTNELGVRPQPGLTSFKIQSKNRFGSIRQAELEFKVWSKEDLSEAQDLFLKPGIQVILEWGNSPYVDNNGTIQEFNYTDSDLFSYFSEKPFQYILDLIESKRKATSFNYDGFLGMVSNFSFSLTPDGGYDCTLTVVTQGTVLDSLTTQTTSTYLPEEEEEVEDAEKTKIHKILSNFESKKVKRKQKSGGTFLPITLETEGLDTSIVQDIKNELEVERLVGEGINRENIFKLPGFFTKKDVAYRHFGGKRQNVFYLTMRNFLAICNISFAKLEGNTQRLGGSNFSLDPGLKYNTFKNHFSFNPLVCLLPKTPTQEELKNIKVDIRDIAEKNNIHETIENSLIYEPDDIMELRIATPFLLKELEEFFAQASSPEDANLIDYVRRVLSSLNDALGGINEFDLYYDEDIDRFRVADRKINPYFDQGAPKIPLVNVTGLKTQVSNLSIQSKISSELSSMIAIASQASDSTSLNKDPAYIKWMDGSRSRFRFTGKQAEQSFEGGTSPEQAEFERYTKFLEDLNKAYDEFNGRGLAKRSYDSELFDAVKVEGFKRTKEAINSEKESKGETNGALIPIEISLILPNKYNDYAFIITSLNHSIENEKWFTELGGILFKVSKDEAKPNPQAGEYVPLVPLEVVRKPAVIGNPFGGPPLVIPGIGGRIAVRPGGG